MSKKLYTYLNEYIVFKFEPKKVFEKFVEKFEKKFQANFQRK